MPELRDPSVHTLWERRNRWAYEGFGAPYRRLECRFEKVYHERETYERGQRLVLEGLDNTPAVVRQGWIPVHALPRQ